LAEAYLFEATGALGPMTWTRAKENGSLVSHKNKKATDDNSQKLGKPELITLR
jgi:hypothetical protein